MSTDFGRSGRAVIAVTIVAWLGMFASRALGLEGGTF